MEAPIILPMTLGLTGGTPQALKDIGKEVKDGWPAMLFIFLSVVTLPALAGVVSLFGTNL
jgi:hypothetical protein